MSSSAVALVLAAAVAHASWNFLAKRVGGGASFVWLFQAVALVLYAPVALGVLIWQGMPTAWNVWLLILASAVLHAVYFIALNRGYQIGDLSLVYPLARGTGPMWATLAAVLILGERPHPIALLGAALVIGGAILLTGDPGELIRKGAGPAVFMALLVGMLIGAYTLVDKEAVSAVLIPPVIYSWLFDVGMVLLLAPRAFRERDQVMTHWRMHRREAIAIGALNPLGYILVLFALVFSPVSYIAPAREISVLFGAAMGTRLLREGHSLRRISLAGAMVAGVILLAM